MSTELIIVLGYSIAIIIALALFKPKKEDKHPSTFIANDYDTLMSILDNTIQRELRHHYELIYKLQDIRIIYNIQEDLALIVKEIMASFSPNLLKQLEIYHSKDYVIKYVTRTVEIFLIEYTKKNKITAK